MQPPEDYWGDLSYNAPSTYIDVTSMTDDKRHAIAGLNHPYYVLRQKVYETLMTKMASGSTPLEITTAIMEVL